MGPITSFSKERLASPCTLSTDSASDSSSAGLFLEVDTPSVASDSFIIASFKFK